jgi:hypothetical protein
MMAHNKVMLAGAFCALANVQCVQAFCSKQYGFSIGTHTIFNYDQIKDQGQQTHITLSGVLTVKEAQFKGENGWWAIKADNVYAGNGQYATELHNYTLPFAFRLTQQGLISEFWFSAQLDKQAQDQLKGLAYYFQFQRDPKKPLTREQDTLGQYAVSYVFKENHIQFNKKTYQLADRGNGALQTVKIESSDHKVISSTCFFTSREGEESLIFSGQSNSLNLKTKQQYRLTLAQKAYPSVLLSMPTNIHHWQQQITLSKAELTTLTQSLRRFVLNHDLTQIPAHTLAQQLAKFDAVIDSLSHDILEKKLTDRAQMRLFNALGQLDSSNSQQLLGYLLVQAEKNPLIQFRALRALSQGQNSLTPELTSLLKAQVETGFNSLDSEVTSSFYMTIGAMLYERQPNVQAQKLHDALSEQLSLETNNKIQSALITSLGNSRNEQHFEQIDRFVNDTNKSVQKASLRALGMLGTTQAYESLEKQLAQPTHNNQVALLSALVNYQLKPAASDAVLAIAVNDLNEESRYAAIKTLAEQNNQTGIKQTLKSALRSEKSRRNFQAIVELLNNSDKTTQN